MKQLLSLFLFLLPWLALAQYPSNGNQKVTLGEQTTADGLVYRGVAATDTVRKPSIDTMAYMVLDTTTNIIWHYKKATSNAWLRLNLLPSDTASMLTPYFRKLDTASIAYVNTFGTQTVNGVKTFTDTIIVNKGIRFPATQSASTNVNTLDDYEEGTFTPSWSSTGATFVYDAAYRHGRYTKIGNTVYISLHISTSEIPGGTITNAVTISGLPFVSGNVDNSHFSAFNYGYLYNIDWPASKTQATAIMNRNSSTVAMQWEQDSTASGQWLASALRAYSYLIINGFYFVP
jgi:hypothetical protein